MKAWHWILIIVGILIVLGIIAYFVFIKKSFARSEGEGEAQCDRLAPIPPKGMAKGEAGGYCIPSEVDLFGLDPNNPQDRDEIFEWMKYIIDNNWPLDGTMGQLANAAAYQVTERRAGR